MSGRNRLPRSTNPQTARLASSAISIATCYHPLVPAKAGTQEIPVMSFFVYILASRRNGTLYVGMTDNLARRVWEHQTGAVAGFTKRYGVKTLVWYEPHESREGAFQRERQLKKWNRAWKLKLIEVRNPDWRDLTGELI
jgi:putative endonuclease